VASGTCGSWFLLIGGWYVVNCVGFVVLPVACGVKLGLRVRFPSGDGLGAKSNSWLHNLLL
jgi:hypothetical protein